MKKQIYLMLGMMLIGMILLMVISVNAEKINEPINLIQSCNNCSYCNVSKIVYPNSTIFLTNLEMTKDGSSFNYTLDSSYINLLGTYNWWYDCGNDIESQTGKLSFEVTVTGNELTQSQGTLYIVIFVILIIFFFLTFYGAMIFPWKNNRDEDGSIISINDLKYLKVALWIFVYLEMLFIIFILRNLSLGFLPIDGTYAFFNMIFNFMLIGLLPLFPCLIFFTIVIWLSDKRTQKMLQRGIDVR